MAELYREFDRNDFEIAAVSDDVESGRMLAFVRRYRLAERIGSGGMSVVWRAHDAKLDRDVAVKMPADPGAADPLLRDGIRAEAQAVAQLAHPHVARVFDYGEMDAGSGDRVPFLVMELLRGTPLSTIVASDPLAPELAMRVCAQVAGGLAAVHTQGLVHRDVKPGNIMLTAGGAKVFDFGIAVPAGTVDGHSPDDVILGTPAYLAPERLVGAAVSPATDAVNDG